MFLNEVEQKNWKSPPEIRKQRQREGKQLEKVTQQESDHSQGARFCKLCPLPHFVLIPRVLCIDGGGKGAPLHPCHCSTQRLVTGPVMSCRDLWFVSSILA